MKPEMIDMHVRELNKSLHRMTEMMDLEYTVRGYCNYEPRLRAIQMCVDRDVWSEKHGEYKHPDGLIENIKERLPKFIKKRWPVKYKTITFSILYPNFKYMDGGHVVRIAELSPGEWK